MNREKERNMYVYPISYTYNFTYLIDADYSIYLHF